MKLCVFLGELVSLPFATPACGLALAQDCRAATLAGSQHGQQILLKSKAGLSLEEHRLQHVPREVGSSQHRGSTQALFVCMSCNHIFTPFCSIKKCVGDYYFLCVLGILGMRWPQWVVGFTYKGL